jgi:hypothetical protein
MPRRPKVIWLFGERQFASIEVDDHREVELLDLGLSDATNALVQRWLTLVRDDLAEQHDEAVLAGVRAAAAIARELDFTVSVNIAMRDPRVGDWFSLDTRNPGDARWLGPPFR